MVGSAKVIRGKFGFRSGLVVCGKVTFKNGGFTMSTAAVIAIGNPSNDADAIISTEQPYRALARYGPVRLGKVVSG